MMEIIVPSMRNKIMMKATKLILKKKPNTTVKKKLVY